MAWASDGGRVGCSIPGLGASDGFEGAFAAMGVFGSGVMMEAGLCGGDAKREFAAYPKGCSPLPRPPPYTAALLSTMTTSSLMVACMNHVSGTDIDFPTHLRT